jgi:exopolysaccharide biosynthesis protein
LRERGVFSEKILNFYCLIFIPSLNKIKKIAIMQLKKTTIILLITLSLSIFYAKILRGQSPADSLALKTVQWTIEDLGKGVEWHHFHFSEKQVFNSNQNIHFLKFKNKSRKINVKFADLEDDSLRLTSAFASQNKALAAVNGSFFSVKQGFAVDLIKIDGKILDTTELVKGKLSFHQKSAVVVHKNKLKILKGDTTNLFWDRRLKQKNVMVTGPLLMYDGERESLSKTAFNDNRHPRTCACVTHENDVILLTVDGRTTESQGVSLAELSFLMQNLNCKDAINLDGGGSTTMYIRDKGVVNMPCDNKKFDHEGERKVSNIIFIRFR